MDERFDFKMTILNECSHLCEDQISKHLKRNRFRVVFEGLLILFLIFIFLVSDIFSAALMQNKFCIFLFHLFINTL